MKLKMGLSMRSMISACATIALAAPFVVGCGGGVATEPTVAIKRDKTGAPAADGAAAPTAPAGSGGAAAPAAGGGIGSWKGKVILDGGEAPKLPLIVKAGAPVRDAEVCGAADMP